MENNALTQPKVSLLNPTTGALTDATISFRVFNAVPPGGAVRITFPPGFSFFGPGDRGSFAFGGAVTATSSGLAHSGGDPLDAVSRARGRVGVRVTRILTLALTLTLTLTLTLALALALTQARPSRATWAGASGRMGTSSTPTTARWTGLSSAGRPTR